MRAYGGILVLLSITTVVLFSGDGDAEDFALWGITFGLSAVGAGLATERSFARRAFPWLAAIGLLACAYSAVVWGFGFLFDRPTATTPEMMTVLAVSLVGIAYLGFGLVLSRRQLR